MNRQYAELLATPVEWNEECLAALLQWEESEILAQTSLALCTYGTVRILSASSQADRTWTLHPPIAKGLNFGVEELPSNLHHIVNEQGTSVRKILDHDRAKVKQLFYDACEAVCTLAPMLFQSIRYLLRSFHVIRSNSPKIDVSFSVPSLPNSIFGSIPGFDDKEAVARLAETIVHEVLHLQLTLVEKYCPIVRLDMETRYMISPWRNCPRPEISVIHGLFVFRTLEILWSQVNSTYSESLLSFANRRVSEIHHQLSSLKDKKFDSLTEFGQKILAGIFDEIVVNSAKPNQPNYRSGLSV